MLPASALPRLAAVYSTRPVNNTGRRPTRSAIGPQNSCATPNARISADRVSWADAIEAPSSRVSAGNAGR